jgi:hypothetical protein
MSEPTEIVQRVTRAMHCSKCGVEAAAACDCGAPYLPATARAAKAIAENPGKSNRAIAAEIGVDHKTVGAARKAGGEHSPPERVTGKDGKSYPARASNDVDPEASAEARKAEYAADDESESGCVTSADDSAPTKQPLRAEVARLIRRGSKPVLKRNASSYGSVGTRSRDLESSSTPMVPTPKTAGSMRWRR